MHRGFVKLWRKSKESAIYSNHKVWRLWIHLLMSVTHKKIKVMAGHQTIELLPGQIISGRNKLAQETGLSPHSVRLGLKVLKNGQRIAIKPTNRFSIITIVNWQAYQDRETINNQQNNQQPGRQSTSKPPLNKNVKNVEEIKEPASGSIFNLMDTLSDRVQGICFDRRIKFNPKQWVMVQTRNNIHPGAIIEALESMIAHQETVEDFWAWGDQVVKVQSGNYAERDSLAQATGHKQDLIDLIASIGGKQ